MMFSDTTQPPYVPIYRYLASHITSVVTYLKGSYIPVLSHDPDNTFSALIKRTSNNTVCVLF